MRDDVWIDRDFNPLMRIDDYDAARHPIEVETFARLNQDMVVVAEAQAFRLYSGQNPSQPVLQQNSPNPFNASTVIPFTLPEDGRARVRLDIFNLAGQQVRQLVDGSFGVGSHQVSWDGKDDQGRDVATGVYVYRLQVGNTAQTREMVMLR